ncbi:MAG: Calx-beta domain-containing protein [Caldilineaceae bacterium]
MKIGNKTTRVKWRLTILGVALLLTLLLEGGRTLSANAAPPFPAPGAGYLDYVYGPTVNSPGRTPTESKPESKLWWNDGFWWGSLFNPTANAYHIYRLDWGAQTWEDTGVRIDDRVESRADTLWDEANQKLYIASHFAQLNSSDTTNPDNYARLYRYSYAATTQSYSLDQGFPVNVNHDKTEALVLTKDSTGRLWVTYISRFSQTDPNTYKVFVNATIVDAKHPPLVSDTNWGSPLDLTTLGPISGGDLAVQARVELDDLTAIVAFNDNGGPKVGLLWSNQLTSQLNFAWHADSVSSIKSGWTLQQNILPTAPPDDHLNLKALKANASGQVFAAVKTGYDSTSNNPTAPLMGLLARDVDGTFTFRTYSTVAENDTRPLLLLDEGDLARADDNQAYLFVSGEPQGGQICYKALALPAPTGNLAAQLGNFPAGNCGVSFLLDATNVYTTFRDPTSTKQNVNKLTGMVVLAADVNQHAYAHNVLGNPPPVVTNRLPARDATDFAVNSEIAATFSKPMNSATLNSSTFNVAEGANNIAGAFHYDPTTRTGVFQPNSVLKAHTTYTVKLTNAIQDTTNLPLDAFKAAAPNTVVEQWTFTTGNPVVQFAAANYNVLESAGAADITVTLSAPVAQVVTVQYATKDGTAIAGKDYTASSGALTFNAGETVKAFKVPILNDTVTEGNETLQLTLSNAKGGVDLGGLAEALLTINEDTTGQSARTIYLPFVHR